MRRCGMGWRIAAAVLMGNALKNYGQRIEKSWAMFSETTGNVLENDGQ